MCYTLWYKIYFNAKASRLSEAPVGNGDQQVEKYAKALTVVSLQI